MTTEPNPTDLQRARVPNLDRDPEAETAKALAEQYGLGIVQVSARRYLVVLANGVSASKRSGERWEARMGYRTLTRPVDLSVAQEVSLRLFRAAEQGFRHLGDEIYRVMTGPVRPTWLP